MAVSIHAPRCRGAMRRILRTVESSMIVSIHAPRCRGAMRDRCRRDYTRPACFNPRPSLPRGDAASVPTPRPEATVSIHAPRCRGAMLHVDTSLLRVGFVSIHAPRCRGAMRGEEGAAEGKGLFQSTPLVAEGRCQLRLFNPRIQSAVSIHAPRCRGAMPICTSCQRDSFTSFNPRPSLPRGDAAIRRPGACAARCFNPRPSLPRGDACVGVTTE